MNDKKNTRNHAFYRILISLFFLLSFQSIFHTNVQAETSPNWVMVSQSPFDLFDPPFTINPVLIANDVTDVSASFVADPFLFHEDNTWYMFLEVYNTNSNKGEIGMATSSDGLDWDYQEIVLSEPKHLSYPLILKANGEYYMIPETSMWDQVRIYRANNFPYEWTFLTTIASGRNFVDPTIFHYNDKWWMFVGEPHDTCYLYYSDELLSGWVEHPMSPIVDSYASIARPGGRSFVFNGDSIIRIAQKCCVYYGQRVRAFEVDVLNEEQYAEHEISESPILYESGTGWNAAGMHHFDPWWTGNQWLCAVDGQVNGKWSIGIYITHPPCSLKSRFVRALVNEGMEYYTDRSYNLTHVPPAYKGLEAILTPNDDRNRTDASDYLTFELADAGTVFVAYDSRAISEPDWMNGFIDTGDVLLTSLSSQPSLKIYYKEYAKGECVNFGANKALGFTGDTVSNYIVFYNSGGAAPTCSLASRFKEKELSSCMAYYTDRDYTLNNVPAAYVGLEAIITPNNDRNLTTTSNYLTFELADASTVFVAYDSRAISEPDWMNGFIDTGDVLLTSLSSQPSLKIYYKEYAKGECVNFGANKAPGFTGDTVSNYIVMYAEENGGPIQCELDSRFEATPMQIGVFYYTDRSYAITGGVPDWMLGRTLIQTPNDERNNTSNSGYIRFTNPVDWWVYVLFDSRSASIPDWLNGWVLRSEKITTSLGTQPYLKVYRKMFNAGECVDFGGNYGLGASGETRSNYVVVYGK